MQKETKLANLEYLNKNKDKKDVVIQPSGLQHRLIKPGSRVTPRENDIVTVHYKGFDIDGREFDSSYKHGEPAKFVVNEVIKGWAEGLQLMQVGETRELVIPDTLAYGSQGPMANRTLIYTITLLAVESRSNNAEG